MSAEAGSCGVALLAAENLTRVLEGPTPVALVRGITLTIAPGEMVAITGPSGSGKSSLLYLLGLLDRPTSGRVSIAGTSTEALSGDALADFRLRRLGFVFQFHFLLPEFSARDNLLLPMRCLGGDPNAQEARADALLDQFGLTSYAAQRPGQLSGGQRQRVAIARALANDPLLLLADEPTGNLDSRNALAVFEIFAEVARTGRRAVVVVTHDLELARRASRRIHLVDGALVD